MSFALHEATASNHHFEGKMYSQSVMTLHVRGPGETGGAFGFALIFLVLFASRQKEQKTLRRYTTTKAPYSDQPSKNSANSLISNIIVH